MKPALRPISHKRHRFPPDVIRHAVWLNFRSTLSLRDVEVSYATTLTDPCLRKVSRLAFLAPDIQRAILDGRQPAGLTLKAMRLSSLPCDWEARRRLFGFGEGGQTPRP